MANTLKLASAPVFIGCAPLGALAPASRCSNIELEATLNPPPAGSYIVSLVLLEGGVACPPSAFGVTGAYESGDGRCVRAWRRFTDKLDFSASGVELELFAFVETGDVLQFLEVREQVLLRVAEVIESGGSAFAAPP